MEYKRAVIFCIIGGVLMLLGSVIGSIGFIGKLLSLAIHYVNPEIEFVIQIVLTIFGYIAMGGGLSVIVGALIAGYSSDRLGRFIAGLGIGAGLISLIILIITTFTAGGSINDIPTVFLTVFNNGYGVAGALITIFSRRKLKD